MSLVIVVSNAIISVFPCSLFFTNLRFVLIFAKYPSLQPLLICCSFLWIFLNTSHNWAALSQGFKYVILWLCLVCLSLPHKTPFKTPVVLIVRNSYTDLFFISSNFIKIVEYLYLSCPSVFIFLSCSSVRTWKGLPGSPNSFFLQGTKPHSCMVDHTPALCGMAYTLCYVVWLFSPVLWVTDEQKPLYRYSC